jgi:hypothetical protein
MPVFNARQFHTQQTHYLRFPVTFNEANIATGVVKGTLPAGSQILDIGVNITTAFNAGTTNVLVLGSTAGGTNIATNAETVPGTLGFKRCTTGCALSPLAAPLSADTDVFAQYTQTGAAATAGAATIVIAYIPNNDR